MAIETGAIFKRLYFDGTSSGDFGVYISGAGTFNAPARDIEMVSIPGRNGALALDRGRFENIEVTYKAGLFGVDEADFAEAISEFRNFLCSRSGYVRLEDDYNPDEYRMAVYKSGLDVKADVLKAGEFDLVFDCKPQRWLKSGETAVTVASGDTLTNPTLFESSPLLEVDGYGAIGFNGYEIDIEHAILGELEIAPESQSWDMVAVPEEVAAVLNSGDPITIKRSVVGFYFYTKDTSYGEVNSVEVLSTSGDFSCLVSPSRNVSTVKIVVPDNSVILYYPTRTEEHTTTITFKVTTTRGYTDNVLVKVGYNYRYYSSSRKSYIQTTILYTSSQNNYVGGYKVERNEYQAAYLDELTMRGRIYAYSNTSILGDPTYIDCDYGEGYLIQDGTVISLNRYIDLGSDLPKLASGANEITFDDTITELKVHPRWWKV